MQDLKNLFKTLLYGSGVVLAIALILSIADLFKRAFHPACVVAYAVLGMLFSPMYLTRPERLLSALVNPILIVTIVVMVLLRKHINWTYFSVAVWAIYIMVMILGSVFQVSCPVDISM